MPTQTTITCRLHVVSLKANITKKRPGSVTCAVAAVAVRVQRPPGITGALHRGLVLLAHLAALEVTAAVVHRFACLVAGVQVEPRGTKTHDPFSRCHGALVAAAASGCQAHIWGEERPNVLMS